MADNDNVIVISSTEQFKAKINDAKEAKKLVMIKFTATWCGPCRMMAPLFAELSKKHLDVVFLEVDTDDQTLIAQECNVSAIPTFVFVKNGAEVNESVNASKPKLEAKVAELASAADAV